MTALGPVRLTRVYRISPDGEGYFPADLEVGLDGFLTRAAERMAVFAGARDSFARAGTALQELAGWTLNRESLRQLTHATARRVSATRGERNDAVRFARAAGVVETAIDAGKVNTATGWRDVKVAIISKRRLGKPASEKDGINRKLPSPTVVTVVASIEGSDTFTERVRAEADRLNVTTAADVTVLADGADWIWTLAEEVFPQAAGVLDFYHVAEHIADAVKAIWPAGEQADGLYASGRLALLTGGKTGLERWIGEAFLVLPSGNDGEPLRSLAAYVAPHPKHLDYAGRLKEGRSIGSGQVEGAIKQLVNRRLKRTGARWRVTHVGPLVELVALIETPEWNDIWTAA